MTQSYHISRKNTSTSYRFISSFSKVKPIFIILNVLDQKKIRHCLFTKQDSRD